jgi:hypothetical protein
MILFIEILSLKLDFKIFTEKFGYFISTCVSSKVISGFQDAE